MSETWNETKKQWKRVKKALRANISLRLMMLGLDMMEKETKQAEDHENQARVCLLGLQTCKLHMRIYP